MCKANFVGNRCINQQCLVSNPLPVSFRQILQGSKIVQLVSQLYQNNTRVFCCCKQKVLQILQAVLVPCLACKQINLCNSFNQKANLFSKKLLNLPWRCFRVLQNVVQKPGCNNLAAQPHFGKGCGCLQRMYKIRLFVCPSLALVSIPCKEKGLFNKFPVCRAIIFLCNRNKNLKAVFRRNGFFVGKTIVTKPLVH